MPLGKEGGGIPDSGGESSRPGRALAPFSRSPLKHQEMGQ